MQDVRTLNVLGVLAGLFAITAGGVGAQDGATITVAPDGSADHETISAAIEAASDGDTILIAPGTYVEGLVIGKDLVISGQGGGADVSIEGPAGLEKHLVGFEDEAFEVLIWAEDADVVIEHVHLGEIEGYGFVVSGGSAVIRDVTSLDEVAAIDASTFEVTDSDVLAVWVNSPGEVVVRGNTLRQGAFMVGGAQATFEDNEVLNLPIVADDGASITVTGNTFRPAEDDVAVVVTDPEVSGYISDNEISGGWAGIIVEYSVDSSVEGNVIDGAANGIIAVETAAMIRDNTITGAAENGIHTIGEGMTIEGNTVEGGRVGLYAMPIAGPSHPRATDYQTGPFVRGNTITGASHFGVLVDEVPAELSDNVICAERESLRIEGEANLVIGSNEICGPGAE